MLNTSTLIPFTFETAKYNLRVYSSAGDITGLELLDDDMNCIDEIPGEMDRQGTFIHLLEQVNSNCMRIAKVAKNHLLFHTALIAIHKYLENNPEKPASGASVLSSTYRKMGRPDLAIKETGQYRNLDNAQALLNSRAAAMIDMITRDPADEGLWIAKATNECERSLTYGLTPQLENVIMRLKSITNLTEAI
jgi:hypothetical protein